MERVGLMGSLFNSTKEITVAVFFHGKSCDIIQSSIKIGAFSDWCFLAKSPTINFYSIIADIKWISYALPSRFMNVKPKNQKEVHHENFTSCKNLD
jgi:hypothetical protein